MPSKLYNKQLLAWIILLIQHMFEEDDLLCTYSFEWGTSRREERRLGLNYTFFLRSRKASFFVWLNEKNLFILFLSKILYFCFILFINTIILYHYGTK